MANPLVLSSQDLCSERWTRDIEVKFADSMHFIADMLKIR
jgi:hypothetical protein